MIIVLKPEATKEQADELLARIEERGLKSLYMPGSERTVLGALGVQSLVPHSVVVSGVVDMMPS